MSEAEFERLSNEILQKGDKKKLMDPFRSLACRISLISRREMTDLCEMLLAGARRERAATCLRLKKKTVQRNH